MDFKPFKLDIDELINEFAKFESTTFAEFKRVWLSRKFSYIFEACPTSNHGLFMQSLYAHCIGYMVSTGSFSSRLGGLYCLYCLYETQPFVPPFKVYLSLGELKRLKYLSVDAKTMGVKVASALLKRMLEKNIFLFGFVGANESSATERISELTVIQNARIQAAYKKLFANSRLEDFIHMDLDMELDVDLVKKRSSEYAAAKEVAIKEASQVIDVQNVKHIAENKKLIGDVVEKAAADWNSQKELFYRQTGFDPPRAAEPSNQKEHEPIKPRSSSKNLKRKEPCDEENSEELEDRDDFDKELEKALLLQPLEGGDYEDE